MNIDPDLPGDIPFATCVYTQDWPQGDSGYYLGVIDALRGRHTWETSTYHGTHTGRSGYLRESAESGFTELHDVHARNYGHVENNNTLRAQEISTYQTIQHAMYDFKRALIDHAEQAKTKEYEPIMNDRTLDDTQKQTAVDVLIKKLQLEVKTMKTKYETTMFDLETHLTTLHTQHT